MKIRHGFVSNSSSTSYVVVFVPEPSNLNLKTFDFLLKVRGNRIDQADLKIYRDTVASRREALEKEIKTAERDIAWIKNKVGNLIECSQIPAVQLLMDELDSYNQNIDAESIRHIRRYSKKEKWSESIKNRIESYNKAAKELDDRIVESNNQLNMIKDLPADSVIAAWDEDLGGPGRMLSELLNELEPDGRVIVLKKETT